MICQECDVRVPEGKLDAFIHEGEVWCSEVCCDDAGWYGPGDLSPLTAVLLAELETEAKEIPADCALSTRDHRFIHDAVAILRIESGAKRQAGPPATVAMLLSALQRVKARGWYSGTATADFCGLWPGTIAQLAATLTVLQELVDSQNWPLMDTRRPGSTCGGSGRGRWRGTEVPTLDEQRVSSTMVAKDEPNPLR